LLVGVATANALGDVGADLGRISDFHLLEAAGAALFDGRWADVFADPGLQVGVLAVLLGALVVALEGLTGVSGSFWFAATAYLGITFAIVWLVRVLYRRLGRTCPPVVELGMGLVVVIAGVPMLAVVSGHLSEAVIPLLWVLAARDARDGHPVRAGSWIGIACGFKAWGFLALPLALLAWGRSRLTIGAVAGTGAALLYLPFLSVGDANILQYEWSVTRWSLIASFLEPESPFTWEMRLAQGVVTATVGAATVLALRTRSSVIWAGPLSLVVVRLATDPLAFRYYWLAAEVLVVVALAVSLPTAPRPAYIASSAAASAALLAKFVPATAGARVFLFSTFLVLSVTRLSAPERNEGDDHSLSRRVESV